jgi:4-amino-4-deoxychorismate lyase
MSPLLETIKIKDGHALNLHLHEMRMKHSVLGIYGNNLTVNLERIIQCPPDLVSGVVKCRVIYSNAVESVTFEAYKPRLIRSLRLVYTNDIEYQYKYLDRGCFTHLLDGIEEDDILIVKHGLITDTSFANIICWDGTRWITPKTPLLRGTKRQQLIKAGSLTEADIHPSDLEQFPEVRIINAMLDPMDNPGIKEIRS